MPRVLVVEDEPVILRLLEETLAGDGADVVTVRDADAALVALREEQFDVVLVDLLLPGQPGWRVLEQLRSSPEGSPVVVVSARATPSNLTRAFDLGAVDVFGKPFDPLELSACVNEVAGMEAEGLAAHRQAARTRRNA
ncbi:MAG TPA: response regulator [Acidimicrobiales bacterium]|jgi:two-component system OmpR family response regulator/two-component system response regulator QseB|nr:response regulator [Acidimicrobiales bacterium]